jgi:hypothetical protein
LAASAGLDSAFFSSFFLKIALNLAFKLLSAFGAVRGAGQHWNESEWVPLGAGAGAGGGHDKLDVQNLRAWHWRLVTSHGVTRQLSSRLC